MSYDSITVSKSQAQFSQDKPLNYCRKCRSSLQLSRELITAGKIQHIIKCRNARCSHECRINWSKKQAAIENIFLRDDLPTGCVMYRGSLTMPRNATPERHARAKKAFLRSMKRWTTRKNCIFELHATLHITDPNNAHWDVIAYSNAKKTPLGKAVSAAWSRAGGKSHSLPILDPDEVEAATRYKAKDEQVKVDRKNNKRYLARPRAEIGLNYTWHTKDFWQGMKPKDLWRKQIEEWKADGVFKRKPANNCECKAEPLKGNETDSISPVQDALKGRSDALRNGSGDGSALLSQSLDDSDKQELLLEIERLEAKMPQRDASNAVCVLPEALGDAVGREQVGLWAELPTGRAGAILDDQADKPGGVRRVVVPARPGGNRRYWTTRGEVVKPYMIPESLAYWIDPVEQVRDDRGRRL